MFDVVTTLPCSTLILNFFTNKLEIMLEDMFKFSIYYC